MLYFRTRKCVGSLFFVFSWLGRRARRVERWCEICMPSEISSLGRRLGPPGSPTSCQIPRRHTTAASLHCRVLPWSGRGRAADLGGGPTAARLRAVSGTACGRVGGEKKVRTRMHPSSNVRANNRQVSDAGSRRSARIPSLPAGINPPSTGLCITTSVSFFYKTGII